MQGLGKRKTQRLVHETRPPSHYMPAPDDPFIATMLPPARIESPTGQGMSRASVVIEPYEAMSVGDRIVIAWEERLIALPPLAEEEIGKPLSVPIRAPLRTLKAIRDIRVTWQFHDAAGKWSRWAPPAFAPVRCSGSYAPTPWLEGTLDDRGRTYMRVGREFHKKAHFARQPVDDERLSPPRG